MTNFTLKTLTLIVTITAGSYAIADTPAHKGDILTAGEIVPVQVLDFPTRGMSAGKVENELGKPVEVISAVGQPPISRWVYNDRTVYFEFSSVIHVVAK